MEKPSSVFKYRTLTIQALKNLQSRTIYFGPPINFNDPYDCALNAGVRNLQFAEIKQIKNQFLNDKHLPANVRIELEGSDAHTLGKTVLSVVMQQIEYLRTRYLRDIGVSCFSETNDNLLMWSHYADSYKGFCLEFDTTKAPFHKIKQVIYKDSIPVIDPLPMILEDNISQLTDLFCTKSKHWSYEKEWRAIHKHATTAYKYSDTALRAIYFGPKIDETSLEIICTIAYCNHSEVLFFKGYRNNLEFKVDFEQFNYPPNL